MSVLRSILLTGRNYVSNSSKIGVPHLLLPAWVQFSSGMGIIRTGNVANNQYLQ